MWWTTKAEIVAEKVKQLWINEQAKVPQKEWWLEKDNH